MSEKRPQPTGVLMRRLRRVAAYLDRVTAGDPAMAARANTCWQAAARLDALLVRLRELDDLDDDVPLDADDEGELVDRS